MVKANGMHLDPSSTMHDQAAVRDWQCKDPSFGGGRFVKWLLFFLTWREVAIDFFGHPKNYQRSLWQVVPAGSVLNIHHSLCNLVHTSYLRLSGRSIPDSVHQSSEVPIMEPSAFELTLEQQFEMRRMQDAAQNMSREQALEMLIQASKLLMLKDNVIRDLLKQAPLESFT
jgi:hypothetical protein